MEFCHIPEQVDFSNYIVGGPGHVVFRPDLPPNPVRFEGRKVQEYIVPQTLECEDTLAAVQQRVEPSARALNLATAACAPTSQLTRWKSQCIGGVLPANVLDDITTELEEQIQRFANCRGLRQASALPFFTLGSGTWDDTQGYTDPLCVDVLARHHLEQANPDDQQCEMELIQAIRMSCDPTVDDSTDHQTHPTTTGVVTVQSLQFRMDSSHLAVQVGADPWIDLPAANPTAIDTEYVFGLGW